MQFFSCACPAKAFRVVYNANSVKTHGKVTLGFVLQDNKRFRETQWRLPGALGGGASGSSRDPRGGRQMRAVR